MIDDRYVNARKAFRWALPDHLNMGAAILDVPAAHNPNAPALIDGHTGQTTSFGDLADKAARLSGALASLGLRAGDRVAVIAPQDAKTLVVHAALLRAGLISVPLSERYGRDALAHRLHDSGARAVIASHAGLTSIQAIETPLPDLEHRICLKGAAHGAIGFDALLADHGRAIAAAKTGPDHPCLMIYTSGTSGPAKGALHGHRVLAGHGPGFLFAHGETPGATRLPSDAVCYTPADWAWAGGLLNLLFPALARGHPVVFYPTASRFDPADVTAMMSARGVTHAFLPPTALRMMRADVDPDTLAQTKLTSIMAAGEALGRTTYEWADSVFGFPIAEAYGQTECNLILGSSPAHGAMRAGATGVPVPGHDVYVVREDGSETESGELGEIAVAAPNPVMFLGYWHAEEATRRKFLDSARLGRLLMTGDMAMRDTDGFIWFTGRDDDVITSSGHRIGPGEIEDCLSAHPAVATAAVVGVSDPVRTQIVRAFVVLRADVTPSDDLAQALRAHVRTRLAAHEYPRDIRFVDALPTTTTGKIIRRMLKD